MVDNSSGSGPGKNEDQRPMSDTVRGLLATSAQINAYSWLRSRTGYALTLRNTSMSFDLARWVRMMPIVAVLVTLVACGIAFFISMIRPAGVVGDSQMTMDRATGELYVNIDGRLHPALNLSSARLITGADSNPTAVTTASIAGFPKGPPVGIPGAPNSMPVTNGPTVSAAVCQRVSMNSASGAPAVTVINGELQTGSAIGSLGDRDALVGTLNGSTYVVWNGVKAAVNPDDRIVLAALGIDRTAVVPAMPLTPAVGNAIPSGVPLTVPTIPDFGQDSPWDVGVRAPIGSVVRGDVPGQGEKHFIVLRAGLQDVPDTAAAMIRSVDAFDLARPPLVPPDKLAVIPNVKIIQTDQYPDGPVNVVNPRERPVSCWSWQKGKEAAAGTQTVLSGTELPLSADAAREVVPVVGSHREVTGVGAVYMAPDATNYVITSGSSGTSSTAESWWWISSSGARFGLSNSPQQRRSLGLGDDASPMPWVLMKLFPPGLGPNVALSKEDAMTQHGTLPSDPAPAAVKPAN